MQFKLYASALALAAATCAPSAFAQTSEAPEAGAGEIVVTAQRRAQALQDVSASVSAYGAERLEDAQINNLEDLQVIAPSLYLGNDFNMAKLFIRGVGANTSTTGSETGVAMHVDGAFIARAEAQLLSVFDLERIEVLRGPQGTLYGRNAVGGSVNLITAKPTSAVEGYLRGTIGNFGAMNVDAALSGPITDNVLGRIAFTSQTRDGYGENPETGHDVDDLDRQMARGHLLFELSDDFDILLSGEYYTQEDASRALKFRRESYPGLVRLRALGISPAGVRGYAIDPRDLASEVDPKTETEAWAAMATTTWRMSDALTLSNITSYRGIDGFILQDLDVSAIVNSLASNGQNSTVQRRDIFSQQFSSELQLTFKADGVDGVLGAFYFTENQKPVDTIDADPLVGQPHILGILANPATSPAPLPPGFATPLQVDGVFVPPQPINLDAALNVCNTRDHLDLAPAGTTLVPKRVCIHSDLQSDAWALFGQVVFNLGKLASGLEPLSIKLGGRYSREEISASNPSIILARNGLGPVIVTTPDGSFNEREFEAFTPEIGLEWRPASDLLVYYTYSEGFKAGAGQNAAPDANSGWTSLIVDPEEIQNHELGLRSTWLGGRLVFNAAAFTYELQGQQINKTIAGGPAGFSTIWQNAAATSAHGVDVEVSLAPTDAFRLNGMVSWLDSKYDDFLTVDPLDPRNISTPGPCPGATGDPASTCFVPPTGVSIQLAGNRTRNSPEWAANLHAELDLTALRMPDGGLLTLMGDVTYRDDIFFTEFERLLEGQEAYTILDFNLRYNSGAEHFSASLWVKNATDELVASSTFALATARTIGVTYLPPRTFGLTLGYRY